MTLIDAIIEMSKDPDLRVFAPDNKFIVIDESKKKYLSLSDLSESPEFFSLRFDNCELKSIKEIDLGGRT